ncbi:MAG TPA: acyl CoA:acetate/3-ketoacid CoA transferase [Spirochaetia bacterium]|nr:acyl CoA:acetate/3-ketoacid CoA transferase [Spirochaetia bacterium]
MNNKTMTAENAVALIKDNDTLLVGGSGGGVTEATGLLRALQDRFLEQGRPRGLTVVHTTGIGDRDKTGINLLAHEGLVKREIGGHYGMSPKLTRMVLDNKIEAYNFPQGVLTHLYREIAAGRPGLVTHVGIGTYVDPRLDGGKLNARTTEDLVEVINLGGKEWLFYKTFPLDAVFLRGTTADEKGNISMEHEPAILEALAMAQAVHNCGGKVIVQVKRLAKKGTLDARMVRIPGFLVDAVVVDKEQWQVCTRFFDPSLCGEIRIPMEEIQPLPFDQRKFIARRAAMEISPNSVINLGFGMPDGVASIVAEEGIEDFTTLTVEQGLVGGIPQGGVIFGCTANPEAILDQPAQFDFYDGGGLDLTCLGAAQIDVEGNVNSSSFGGNLAGCGGFINISQNAKKVVFCGTFTAGDLSIEIRNGKLKILREGKHRKFIEAVEQITFSGTYARKGKQKVLYVTERAVFELTQSGITLIETAPGIDVDRDVLPNMGFKPNIASPLREMDLRIFQQGRMGLAESMKR